MAEDRCEATATELKQNVYPSVPVVLERSAHRVLEPRFEVEISKLPKHFMPPFMSFSPSRILDKNFIGELQPGPTPFFG
eukprot:119050-Pleurochrysis_carterae.AAC.1